ncbi:MAG: class I SAM-dependent methyltransferase [Chloroflexi bacterium]|nr:class I SAM-dependent methyltransferase [Chloroflexota bacterium]
MTTNLAHNDLLWKNISALPYFRGFLRAVEGGYYHDIEIKEPVLDLGCGDGHFCFVTFEESAFKFIGIDPDFMSLVEAKQYPVYADLICARGDQLPFAKKYFSTTVSNSVLEHIDDVDSVIKEANRVMIHGGKLIICVPNDNFTQYLSLAKFFNRINMSFLAEKYRKFFNQISRHYHPDDPEIWKMRIGEANFEIIRSWNYFIPKSLAILEWGHYFGLPTWFNRKIFGRWILFPSIHNPLLIRIYHWLKEHVERDQKSADGAYSFFISKKE